MQKYNSRQLGSAALIAVCWVMIVAGLWLDQGNAGTSWLLWELLSLPLAAFLPFLFLEKIVRAYLVGRYVETLSEAMYLLGGGIFVMAFTSGLWPPLGSYPVPLYLGLVILWITLYRGVSYVLRRSLVAVTLFRVTAWLIFAFLLRAGAQEIWPYGMEWTWAGRGITVSVPDILFYSCLIAGGGLLFSLVKGWILPFMQFIPGSAWFHYPWLTWVGGCFFCFYWLDLRSWLIVNLPFFNLILLEWIIMGLLAMLLLGGYFRNLAVYTSPSREPPPVSEHVVRIKTFRPEEMDQVSRVLEEFVEKGEKEALASYLIGEAVHAGLRRQEIGRIISPLLYYQPEDIPGFTTRKEQELILERNRKNREGAARKAIDNYASMVKARRSRY